MSYLQDPLIEEVIEEIQESYDINVDKLKRQLSKIDEEENILQVDFVGETEEGDILLVVTTIEGDHALDINDFIEGDE